ncbi:CTB family bacteriocin [Mastigocoleus testarum]|uniref:Bacteriocin n=1 Tax=Mastigocoleus testarum BC008 TaxID=371196 RepID=A0A0V7ZR86_9CYAN|nr:CTB family bacteriocin [Mastigocoleus testarum]KST66871.1 hypothetical protein BC008_27170 [Mastigocoleus testarum BC008]KST70209.1 hypothetical protein BC008_36775 [Mastigocoleus testarum BC008]
MSFIKSKINKLFVQLSEEQEEIVSGGSSFPKKFEGDFGISKTDFLEKASVLHTFSASGPEGSIAGGSYIKELIETSGINAIAVG